MTRLATLGSCVILNLVAHSSVRSPNLTAVKLPRSLFAAPSHFLRCFRDNALARPRVKFLTLLVGALEISKCRYTLLRIRQFARLDHGFPPCVLKVILKVCFIARRFGLCTAVTDLISDD